MPISREQRHPLCCPSNTKTVNGYNFTTRCMLKMAGTYNRYCGVSRLLRTAFADKREVRRSVDEIVAWNFSGMVVGHGRLIAENGSEALREAYAFLKA